MTQLKTTFAGLSLRNPIIISSSSLTNSAEKNKKLELAGAGAIVLKSVFEAGEKKSFCAFCMIHRGKEWNGNRHCSPLF